MKNYPGGKELKFLLLLLNLHADVSCMARGLNFEGSLCLHSYLKYARNKGSDQTAHSLSLQIYEIGL